MKILSKLNQYWLSFLKFFGNIQMYILLILIYIFFIPILWLPVKIFTDSLNLKSSKNKWSNINPRKYDMNFFKLQG